MCYQFSKGKKHTSVTVWIGHSPTEIFYCIKYKTLAYKVVQEISDCFCTKEKAENVCSMDTKYPCFGTWCSSSHLSLVSLNLLRLAPCTLSHTITPYHPVNTFGFLDTTVANSVSMVLPTFTIIVLF